MQRRAIAAVEQEGLAALGQLDQRGNEAALAVREVHEDRLGRHVVVPDVATRGLEAPAQPARRRVEGDNRRTERVGRLGPCRAEEIGLGVARGQVDEPEFDVEGRRRPDVRRAAGVGLAFGRHGGDGGVADIPGPDELARAPVEGPNDARGLVQCPGVPDPSADDDPVAHDRRRGGGIVEPRPNLAHVACQVHDARLAEALADRSGRGVELDQPCVDRREHDARPAGRVRALRHRVAARNVMRHPAAALPKGRPRFGIEPPDQRACLGIDGRDDVVRRAMVHQAIDMERRVLILPTRRRRIAMIETPRDLELVDVRGRDLLERRVARAAGRAPVMEPVGSGCHGLGRHAPSRRRGPVVANDVLRREHAPEEADDADGEYHRNPRGRPPPAAAGECGRQQGRRDRQHHRRHETRNERPKVEARLPDRPD